MPDIEPIIVKHPLTVIFRDDKGDKISHLQPTSYEAYGRLICDLIRHVTRCFEVKEEDVFEWIQNELPKPTTTTKGSTEAPYTEAENNNRISEDIRLKGWALQGVLGSENSSDAMHTIGNHQLGLPELLMLGDGRIAPILSAVCEVM